MSARPRGPPPPASAPAMARFCATSPPAMSEKGEAARPNDSGVHSSRIVLRRPGSAHHVEGRRRELVDPATRADDPVDGEAGLGSEARRARRRVSRRVAGEAAPRRMCAGRPGLSSGPRMLKTVRSPRAARILRTGAMRLKAGCQAGAKIEGVARAPPSAPLSFSGGASSLDAHGREQVRASALRGDRPVAVLHDRDAGAGDDEGDHARDVEPARVVAAGADDVDRPGRPVPDAGVDGERPERAQRTPRSRPRSRPSSRARRGTRPWRRLSPRRRPGRRRRPATSSAERSRPSLSEAVSERRSPMALVPHRRERADARRRRQSSRSRSNASGPSRASPRASAGRGARPRS